LKPETRNILWLSAKLTASPPVPASTERKVATSDIVTAGGTALVTAAIPGGATSRPLAPVLELKLRDGEIRIQIPDFNDDKKTIIGENKGKVVQEPGADNIATITIESAVLKKEIRDRLGIDRVIIPLVGNTDERLAYLKQNGVVIETTREPNKFMLTFARNGRALIQKVADHWGEIVASRATERLKA